MSNMGNQLISNIFKAAIIGVIILSVMLPMVNIMSAVQ